MHKHCIALICVHLFRFLQLSECIQSKKIPPRIGEANIEKEMKQALHDIQLCGLEQLVQNFTVIMDKLIELLVTSCKISGQQLTFGPAVFETMCNVSRMLGVSGCFYNYFQNCTLMNLYL